MEKISAPIREAAAISGIPESTLRREYIRTGLVRTVDLGCRAPSIILAELHAAILKKASEQAADPTLAKPRNAGAKAAAAGRICNPWGRNGKPRSPRSGRK